MEYLKIVVLYSVCTPGMTTGFQGPAKLLYSSSFVLGLYVWAGHNGAGSRSRNWSGVLFMKCFKKVKKDVFFFLFGVKGGILLMLVAGRDW